MHFKFQVTIILLQQASTHSNALCVTNGNSKLCVKGFATQLVMIIDGLSQLKYLKSLKNNINDAI